MSCSHPEKTIDENVLASALSVVIAISISLDRMSEELLLYTPSDSRTIPVEENGFVSKNEKTSEYKKDFCTAVCTIVASSKFCCPQPDRRTSESTNNHHTRFCIFIQDINMLPI